MAATRFCPSCGRPMPASATLCPACGAAVLPPGSPPVYAPAPPGNAPGDTRAGGSYSSSSSSLPSNEWGPNDISAMRKVVLASIVGFVGIVSILFLPYAFGEPLTSLSGSLRNTSTAASALYALIGFLALGGILGIVQFVLMRGAFSELASRDRGFSTPRSLTLLGIIGYAMAIVGAVGIILDVVSASSCAGSAATIPSSCLHGRLVIGLLVLTIIGAVVLFVGEIGVWLGLWRFGTRYGKWMFKVGMILTILSYLAVVGYILIIIAAREVERTARPVNAPPGLHP